jgi:hypothetical protein
MNVENPAAGTAPILKITQSAYCTYRVTGSKYSYFNKKQINK